MKRDAYKVVGECLVFTLAFAILLGFVVACSGDNDVAGGSSVDSGVIAITNKQIAGVAQKGPFVLGSSIVLKETSAAGNLKPTGKEFFATTRSNAGDFVIEGINLESQYVRLTATGYYKREVTGENSECQVRLNALSDVSNRDRVNINVFTHLEYARVLKLIEKGMPFREAKKQAHTDWLNVFDKKHLDEDFEDLDVNGSKPDDEALRQLSSWIDNCAFNEDIPSDKRCTVGQNFVDAFADSFAKSGKLPDDLNVEDYPRNSMLVCWFLLSDYFE
ncbi:hypothetical protein [uncultured Fibrobacter sp.]|uniref:hypothetical protein n=1 Tax=uncultured Fibrobacter sp. TaxID=261512 RepID=UPI0025F36309|nr:hypothetical protein [uncultured Fibrobacter sp.]